MIEYLMLPISIPPPNKAPVPVLLAVAAYEVPPMVKFAAPSIVDECIPILPNKPSGELKTAEISKPCIS